MPPEFGWCIERRQTVDSTMEVAAVLAGGGAPAGTVVVADYQTAGRGQYSRSWLAPAGSSLLFTALLRPPIEVLQGRPLSRVVAERVRDAIERTTGLRANIKDPNDLLVSGRKLAGILCQSSIRGDKLEYLLIGVGINVNIPADQLPVETATSLLVETGMSFDLDRLLQAVLGALEGVPGLTGAMARS